MYTLVRTHLYVYRLTTRLIYRLVYNEHTIVLYMLTTTTTILSTGLSLLPISNKTSCSDAPCGG